MGAPIIVSAAVKSKLDNMPFTRSFSVDELPSQGTPPIRAVYAIQNRVTGNFYIGSSEHVARRFKHHVQALQRGAHHSVKLQWAWENRGRDAFSFIILSAYPEGADLTRAEDRLLKWLQPKYNNISEAADNPMLGRKHRPESIAKMRAAKLGKKMGPKPPCSDAARENMRIAQSNRKKPTGPRKAITEESKRRMSDSRKRLFSEGYVATNRRPIQIYGQTYESGKAAAEALGVAQARVVAYIKDGYGRYLDEPDNGNGFRLREPKRHPKSRYVNVDGVVFPSLTEAAKHYRMTAPGIEYWIKIGRAQYADKAPL